ncbi:MAG TPA: hypothetical protein VKB59_16830 [Micromonosporaceae bacterium]|nr:hypothetical protein [Micromonosporaceae bacterium]
MTTHPPVNAVIEELVIELGAIRPALMRAGRLFLETIAVPTVLLFVLLHTVGLAWALCAVLGWCVVTVAVRWLHGAHMPGTLIVCAGMLCARASVALILSSAIVYLVQPIIGSILMAGLFLGSAFVGRPITVRLARDFVKLPVHILHHHGVRRMFTQVAMLWGVGRLIDAGMSLGFLHYGVDYGLLSRGVFSGLLTAIMIVTCAAWGTRCIRRMPGVTLRLRPLPIAA